jgi:group I intron endonuclease
MKSYGVIYKIENKTNGKVYIGQTTRFSTRMSAHFNTQSKFNPSILKNAIAKYGKDNFLVTTLYTAFNKAELDRAEIEFIAKYDSIKKGYNCKEGGSYGKHTPETIEKLRKSSLGNKRNFGKKKSREIKITFAKSQGVTLPILATELSTGRQTVYVAQFETSEFGFSQTKVSRCLNNKAKDGTLLTHKGHTFEYINHANQSGSVDHNRTSHAQRLGIEPKYEKALNRSKKVTATHKTTQFVIEFNSAKETVEFGFNYKSVRRVLEGGRPFHRDFNFKYLE